MLTSALGTSAQWPSVSLTLHGPLTVTRPKPVVFSLCQQKALGRRNLHQAPQNAEQIQVEAASRRMAAVPQVPGQRCLLAQASTPTQPSSVSLGFELRREIVFEH